MTNQQRTDEGRIDTTTRRGALAALGGVGLLAALGGSAQADVGGGPESNEISHLLSRFYEGPESELPDPGVEGRRYLVTDSGGQYKQWTILRDDGGSWDAINAGFGSVHVEDVAIGNFSQGVDYTIYLEDDGETTTAIDRNGSVIAGGIDSKNVTDKTDFAEIVAFLVNSHPLGNAPSIQVSNRQDSGASFTCRSSQTIGRVFSLRGATRGRSDIEADGISGQVPFMVNGDPDNTVYIQTLQDIDFRRGNGVKHWFTFDGVGEFVFLNCEFRDTAEEVFIINHDDTQSTDNWNIFQDCWFLSTGNNRAFEINGAGDFRILGCILSSVEGTLNNSRNISVSNTIFRGSSEIQINQSENISIGSSNELGSGAAIRLDSCSDVQVSDSIRLDRVFCTGGCRFKGKYYPVGNEQSFRDAVEVDGQNGKEIKIYNYDDPIVTSNITIDVNCGITGPEEGEGDMQFGNIEVTVLGRVNFDNIGFGDTIIKLNDNRSGLHRCNISPNGSVEMNADNCYYLDSRGETTQIEVSGSNCRINNNYRPHISFLSGSAENVAVGNTRMDLLADDGTDNKVPDNANTGSTTL